jgi:excisionase family DNA binding protein
MMKVEEVTAFLRLSRRHVYRLIAAGRIRTVKHTESAQARHFVRRDSVAAYLRSLEGQ